MLLTVNYKTHMRQIIKHLERNGTRPLGFERRAEIRPRPYGCFAPHDFCPFSLLVGCRESVPAAKVRTIERSSDADHAGQCRIGGRTGNSQANWGVTGSIRGQVRFIVTSPWDLRSICQGL